MANLGKTVIVAALDGTFQRKVSICLSPRVSVPLPNTHSSYWQTVTVRVLQGQIEPHCGHRRNKMSRTRRTFLRTVDNLHEQRYRRQCAHYSALRVSSVLVMLLYLHPFSGFSAVLCILVGVWKHPEPHPSSGERGEAPRRLHAVLQRSCLHQEDRSREGGEEAEEDKIR